LQANETYCAEPLWSNMMRKRQRCRLRMGKQSEDKEQVVQPQGGRFNHPYLTPYLTPYRVPHSLPHSLPPSIPHSRRIKQKHCLEITQRLTLFQKIAGRNGVQFRIATPGRKSYTKGVHGNLLHTSPPTSSSCQWFVHEGCAQCLGTWTNHWWL